MSYDTIKSWGKANAPLHMLAGLSCGSHTTLHLAIIGGLTLDGWKPVVARDENTPSFWVYEQGGDSIHCWVTPEHSYQTLKVAVRASVRGETEEVTATRSFANESENETGN